MMQQQEKNETYYDEEATFQKSLGAIVGNIQFTVPTSLESEWF